jgi:hypothetical protein
MPDVRPLRIGLLDSAFFSYDPSITHRQVPPPSIQYTADLSAPVDVVVATCEDAHRGLGIHHPRRVLWLQETSEGHPPTDLDLYRRFDLVLTNDKRVLDAVPQARWLSLIGTWITDFTARPKSCSVSYLAKQHYRPMMPGYVMRERVAREIHGGYDPFGSLFGNPVDLKDQTLKSYRFQIVIENGRYDFWITEKICDTFACKTLPLYWGCPSPEKFKELGFDDAGIIPWTTIEDLRGHLKMIESEGEFLYNHLSSAIETNYRRIQTLYCTEVLLEQVLRSHFGL